MPRIKEHYSYAQNFTMGVAGTTTVQNILIGADADFVVERISITSPNFVTHTIFLKDTSSSREWTSIPVFLNNFAGNYGVNNSPKILFKPKRIYANNSLTITLVSAGADTVQIVFEGYRELLGSQQA